MEDIVLDEEISQAILVDENEQKEISDLQKELERTFDEIFGEIDSD